VIGIMVALLITVLRIGGALDQPNRLLADFLYAPMPLSDNIVIVGIDDLTLGAYGSTVSSWPRTRHAELLDVLNRDGARVVAFDILFLGSTADDLTFAGSIQKAKQSPVGTRTVLASASAENTSLLTQPGRLTTNEALSIPAPLLQQAADRIGYIDVVPDSDGYIRRFPLSIFAPISSVNTALSNQWSFDVSTFLSYLRIPSAAEAQVIDGVGSAKVTLTRQHPVPVDASGQMQINFFGTANSFPVYSYRAAHDGLIDPQKFKGKIVLVGLINATGSTDRYLTPLSRFSAPMSGVEIHANAIESILQNRVLTAQSLPSELVINALFGLLLGLLFSRFRWYWVLLQSLVLMLFIVIVAAVLFTTQSQVIGVLYPMLTVAFVMLGILILDAQSQSARRYRTQRHLDSVKRLAERTAGQLTIEVMFDYLNGEIVNTLQFSDWAIWLWSVDGQQLELKRIPTVSSAINIHDYAAIAEQSLMLGIGLSNNLVSFMPMRFQERPIGVMAALGSPSGRRFSVDQLDSLRILADQSAPIMSSAQFYTEQTRQKELLEAVLQNVPDPILVLDQAGQLIQSNAVAKQLLVNHDPGTTIEQVLNDTKMPDKSFQGIQTVLKNNKPFQTSLDIADHNFILLGTPMLSTQTGWVFVLNDVSVLKERDAFKTQLLRMTSHDLKSPLAVILGYADIMLLDDDPLTEQQRLFIDRIIEGARQMESIISDLLNMERARTGRLDFAPVEFNELLRSVVAEYETLATMQQQKLSLTITPVGQPVWLQADKRQLYQAFSNLVGNALKYTPVHGTISIAAIVAGDVVTVAITDTGYGIAKAAQSKLFQPFYRVRTRITAHIPGTGLGLSLVKEVIEAHKGQLSVESDEGQGSTFYATLPLIRVTTDTI
jgi:signal transduction histidine kinase